MTYLTEKDLYDEALEIAERLWLVGHEAQAARLRNAIDAGSTGTEILMALRWQLAQLTQDTLDLNQETLEMIRVLKRDLDEVLK